MEELLKKITKLVDKKKFISANYIKSMSLTQLLDIFNRLAEDDNELKKLDFTVQKTKLTNTIISYLSKKYSIHIVCEGIVSNIVKNGMKDKSRLSICIKEYNYMHSSDDFMMQSAFIRSNRILEGQKIISIYNEHLTPIYIAHNYTPIAEHDFYSLRAEYPRKKFDIIDKRKANLSMRILDLVAPIGFGARGIIMAPPGGGKTTLMHEMARNITSNNRVHTIMLQVDERPEEVTAVIKKLGDTCEIFYSDFSESADNHVHITDIVLEYAKRRVENEEHVVVFLDSLTRLTRANNIYLPRSTKTLTGGLDPEALHRSKQIFGNARYINERQSLTIIATTLITESRADTIILEEFNGTGNLQIYLSKDMIQSGLQCSIDMIKSGTRNDHLLHDKDIYSKISYFRQSIYELKTKQNKNIDKLIHNKILETANNEELLQKMNIN